MSLAVEEARKIAHTIAFGHAYWKHAADAREAGELMTQSSFEQLILETILSPDRKKSLRLSRTAFWNTVECFLVIHNPHDPDLGTAYWPAEGRDEFESLF